MIILLDGDVWEEMVLSIEKGTPRSGTLIIEKHLPDSQFLHWAKELGGKRILGMVELARLNWTDIDEISPRQVKAAGFPSREILKRTFLTFSKDISAVTVAEMKVAEVEKYWCPECLGVNLNFLNKNIHGNQLPFSCFDCGKEFYTADNDFGSPRIKNVKLAERYCEERIKRIPLDQQAVVAVAGENWLF